jgi:predicted MFS family arabinose efflux permease
MSVSADDRSYRALLGVPSVGRMLVGMQIARIGQSMVSVAIVLFALASYRSAALAGMATFFAVFPGLIVSPLAGALLDRHGRTRLVILDYAVALLSLTLLGVLALINALPPCLLMAIAAVASLTAPLSGSGLRSLLPIIVPSHLWERANAIDSTGFLIASIVGPPMAAALVALCGGPVAFIVIGFTFGVAAIVVSTAPDPPVQSPSTGSLMKDAWDGLVYTWHNRTLRALGLSISTWNLSTGIFTIVIPYLILERLHLNESVVGLAMAVQGVAGMIAAMTIGSIDSRNHERTMLVVPMIGMGLAMVILLMRPDLYGIVLLMVITGLLCGPLDVALFTLRQRRTHPDWTGRAFAVSMSFNYLGGPIGSAITGFMAAQSLNTAIIFGIVTCVVAGIMGALMIPGNE